MFTLAHVYLQKYIKIQWRVVIYFCVGGVSRIWCRVQRMYAYFIFVCLFIYYVIVPRIVYYIIYDSESLAISISSALDSSLLDIIINLKVML